MIPLTLSLWWCNQNVCPSLCWKTPWLLRGPAGFWSSCPSSAAPLADDFLLEPGPPASTCQSQSPPGCQTYLVHCSTAGWTLPLRGRSRSFPQRGGELELGPALFYCGRSRVPLISEGEVVVGRCLLLERHQTAPCWGNPAAWKRRLNAVWKEKKKNCFVISSFHGNDSL